MAGKHARRTRGRRVARGVLSLFVVAGLATAAFAGVQLMRRGLDTIEQPILFVDSAHDESPPSTLPLDASTVGRVSPLELRIDDIELDALIRPVGIADDGELEIPDETEIGWYEHGSVPGLPGATVLAAHVSWNRSLGPFHDLGEVEIGSTVEVVSIGGVIRTYQVVERAMYDKDELPSQRIWRTSGDETLVLITCGGDFDASRHRYRQNIVVYAVPVAPTA